MAYNSTIRIKQKICVNCGRPCIWFSKKRCQQCAKVEDFHAREEQDIKKDDGLSGLIERLDDLVSIYVRYSAQRNDAGEIECYTCPAGYKPADVDAGHYVKRGCMYLRFDISRNIRPQCHSCNRHKYGMRAEFGKRLEEEMPGVTEILLEESAIIHKWSRQELQAMIQEFQMKTKNIKPIK